MESGGFGGAIYNLGNLNIVKCSFKNNTGKIFGGAIYNHNNSFLTITNSDIMGNQADFYGGAICNCGAMTIVNTDFKTNHVSNNYVNGTNNGGAIYNNANGILNVTCCTFTSNRADFYGGAVYSAGILNID